MPRKNRLSRADFNQMRGFKRLQGRFFSLSFGPVSGARTAAGVVVSSKVVPGAVKRNLLKRRVREVLAKAMPHAREGAAYVMYAKKGSGAAEFSDIKADILDLLARTGPSR